MSFRINPMRSIVLFLAFENPEIPKAIVALVSVLVMNHLALSQFPAEHFLGSPPVDKLVAVGKDAITSPVLMGLGLRSEQSEKGAKYGHCFSHIKLRRITQS